MLKKINEKVIRKIIVLIWSKHRNQYQNLYINIMHKFYDYILKILIIKFLKNLMIEEKNIEIFVSKCFI
jgi:hypothetical protein